MRRLERITIAFALLACLCPAALGGDEPGFGIRPVPEAGETGAAEVTVSAGDPGDVFAGRAFEWSVTVRWRGGDGANPRLAAEPAWTNVEPLRSSTTLRAGADEQGRYAEKIFSWTLRAAQPGECAIGAAAIAVTGADGGESRLETVPVGFEAKRPPFSLSTFVLDTWHYIAAVIGGFAAVFAGVTMARRNRSRNVEPPPAAGPESDPAEEALNRAKAMRVEGRPADYMRALERAALIGLRARFPEREGREPAAWLDLVEDELKPVLRRFAALCEEAKYTPAAPAPDLLDRAWSDAERLAKPAGAQEGPQS